MGIDTGQRRRQRRDGAARLFAALAAVVGGAMRSLAFALYPFGREPRRRLPSWRCDADAGDAPHAPHAIDWNDPRIH